MKHVVIVGGGFSGLTTAYFLCQKGFFVEVHEKSSSWGGLLQSQTTPFGLIERAANGMLRSSLLTDLCKELDISLITAERKSHKKFIYRREKARRWPLTMGETLRLLPPLIHFLITRHKKKPQCGQSLAHWVEETFGLETLNYLVAPALQGIYADDPQHMSANLVMNRFFQNSTKKRKSLGPTVAPQRGMGELIEGLVHALEKQSASLHLNSSYTLPPSLPCPHVICTGIKGASLLLKEGVEPLIALPQKNSFYSSLLTLSQKLSQIPRISLISTTIFFKPSPDDLQGFGCLFPQQEKFFHLGVLYNNCIFGNRSDGSRSETWICGDSQNSEVMKYTNESFLTKILEDRQRLQKNSDVLFYEVTRWSEVLPRYGPELEKMIAEWETPPQLYFCGNYMGGIGLSQILDRASQLATTLSVTYYPYKE